MVSSLQWQGYQAWELVVVDDGSSDNTLSIIRDIAAREPRVRLVGHGERLGKVKAFNLAATLAEGDLICHLGGDDLATEDALTARVDALRPYLDQAAVGYFKINAFKDDPVHGTVLPRGDLGSRSGPSSTFTAALAGVIFPVPEELPSEDLWLGEAAAGLAEEIVHDQRVVCHYRMHGGNSNPRGKSFEEMSASIHSRMKFAPMLLERFRGRLSTSVVDLLEQQWAMEQMRVKGDVVGLVRARTPLIERAANLSMAHPSLWKLRQKLGVRVSGWRGR